MNNEAKRIVESLRICHSLKDCRDCKFIDSEIDEAGCVENLFHGAANLIESMAAELEQVKRERDAAVRDMAVIKFCAVCRHDDTKDELPLACTSCGSGKQNWRWRGLCKGNGGGE